MTLTLLRINTILFLVLLLSAATVAKANEIKFMLLKQDNEKWKSEVRELLNFIKKTTERTDLGVNIAVKKGVRITDTGTSNKSINTFQ